MSDPHPRASAFAANLGNVLALAIIDPLSVAADLKLKVRIGGVLHEISGEDIVAIEQSGLALEHRTHVVLRVLEGHLDFVSAAVR